MAYRLGLITGDTKSMLNLFRSVRNDFAHRFEFTSFDDQSIHDRLHNAFRAQKDIYDALVAEAKQYCEDALIELNEGSSDVDFTMEEDWPLRTTFNIFFAMTVAALASLGPDVERIPAQITSRG